MSADNLSLVLKIGGGLFSRKDRHRDVDRAAVRGFARLVADLARRAPGRLVLVVGGGSYGHGAVRNLEPDDRYGALALTEAVFTQKWIWAEALRAEGTVAIPLQLAATTTVDDGTALMSSPVLERVLSLGLLPVLSGDCLVGDDGALHVFGSDKVPRLILPALRRSVRVVALTNVPGIVLRDGEPRVLREVDPERPEEAFACLWPAGKGDTTGGMEGKLGALLDCAREGAECLIMQGDPTVATLAHLLDGLDTWPAGVEYTRIRPRT